MVCGFHLVLSMSEVVSLRLQRDGQHFVSSMHACHVEAHSLSDPPGKHDVFENLVPGCGACNLSMGSCPDLFAWALDQVAKVEVEMHGRGEVPPTPITVDERWLERQARWEAWYAAWAAKGKLALVWGGTANPTTHRERTEGDDY